MKTFRFVTAAILFAPMISLAQTTQETDPEERARQLANATLETMGGLEKWDNTRYLVWENFGERHYWDKWTGDFRWEEDSLTAIMNVHSMDGRFWVDGEEIDDQNDLGSRLERVYARWVNNSYWLIMPYKMLDPGVNLRYKGEATAEGGQSTEMIEMTFGDVGLTPENKYMVYIDRESGLVCQWSWWRHRDNPEPNWTRPWTDWKEYNGIMMSTGRGGERVDIAMLEVPDELPEGIFDGRLY